MTASPTSTSPSAAKTSLGSSIGGILIASIVGMCGGSVATAFLSAGYDVVTHSRSDTQIASMILGGVSTRACLTNALAAALFVAAYPAFPTARRLSERDWGTLRIGIVLGTAMWLVLRAITGDPTDVSVSRTIEVWLGYGLVRGPLIVWVLMPYVTIGQAARAPIRDGQRQIALALAIILPTIFPLVWLGTEAGQNTMIMGALFGLFALVVAAIGVSLLVGGIWQARGRREYKRAQWLTLLAAGTVLFLLVRLLAR